MPAIAIAIAAAAGALLIPQAAAAATAGGLPWESTFQTVANSMTGPVVQYGSVGAIGGLRQKASAVAQTGVDVFIVPAAQSETDLAAARAAGGDDLRIVPVATLEEALDVLVELGGDPIPPPPD